MANTVAFNKTDVNICFKDLEISSIFMCNHLLALGNYHFIKVRESVLSNDRKFNAVCIEDGEFEYIEDEQSVKSFVGEVALNGIFLKD